MIPSVQPTRQSSMRMGNRVLTGTIVCVHEMVGIQNGTLGTHVTPLVAMDFKQVDDIV